MNVNNFLTYIKNQEDVPYLRNRLLDVNMRLFKSSPNYRRIVQSCCKYLQHIATADLEGYSKPFGMSGANVGIPFNIIAVVRKRNTSAEYADVMINPSIVDKSKDTVLTRSNCGSIRLPESINVKRYTSVTVTWYDINGELHKREFGRADGGFTIQHEIDHNDGILITDIEENSTNEGHYPPDADSRTYEPVITEDLPF